MEVGLWSYLNLNQVHFQNQLAKGRFHVEFDGNRSGNKEVGLWTYLYLNHPVTVPISHQQENNNSQLIPKAAHSIIFNYLSVIFTSFEMNDIWVV